MESVIIIAPREYRAELESRLRAEFTLAAGSAGALVIDNSTSRIYIRRDDLVRGELETLQLERILVVIPQPVFYAVDFSDIALCRRVLLLIADDPLLLIDNDHGGLLPGPEFVDLIRSRPEWDWRGERLKSF